MEDMFTTSPLKIITIIKNQQKIIYHNRHPGEYSVNRKKTDRSYGREGILFYLILLATVIAIVIPVSADDVTTSLGVIPAKSAISNLAFANQPTGYYFFKFDQASGGGLNAIHIASSTSSGDNYGQVSTTTSQSGIFYLTDTGGRGYQDDAILLVAVKGKIPDNFAIHIKSSGYTWTSTTASNEPPSADAIQYKSGAIDSTFTKSQFVYGPQTWKPVGNNEPSDYPLYYGQDTTDTTNTFELMFVDLKVGLIGSNYDTSSSLTDYGSAKVEYSIENLDTVATFNVYAWNYATTQGQGISWANRVYGTSSSGYTVLGTNYANDASEFPTAEGSAPVYNPPDTNFSANVTNGMTPLSVQFNDTTTKTVTSWNWDFGDGSTSTEQNPVHTYTTAGTYTVSLTAATHQGTTATKTLTNYITISSGSSTSASSSGEDSSGSSVSSYTAPQTEFRADVTTGFPPLTVHFTDTSTIQNITKWTWDLNGDGIIDSSDKNPSFTYRKNGNYTVNLTITTGLGTSFKLSKPQFIHVSDTLFMNCTEGWISSERGDPTRKISVSALAVKGVSITESGSVQSVSVNSSAATVSGNIVTLKQPGVNWSSVAITLNERPLPEGSNLTGTVKQVKAVLAPVMIANESLGTPNITLSLDLTGLPDPGSSLTNTVSSLADDTSGSAFSLAVTTERKNLDSIAYTVNFGKTGIGNAASGGIIKSAMITMEVSDEWVTAHGGRDHIAILHRCDDGTTTVLPTTFVQMDNSGKDVFSAVSPTGLSTFALAAVSSQTSSSSSRVNLPGITANEATGTATYAAAASGGYSSLGTKISAILTDLIIVILVIGAGIFIWKRKGPEEK